MALQFADYWWNRENEKPHEGIFESVRYLQREQDAIYRDFEFYIEQYMDRELSGLSPKDYSIPQIKEVQRSISVNLAKSGVDTLMALMAVDQPAVRVLTSGGNWMLQQRARQLEKFVLGKFYDVDMYEKSQMVFRDAAITGLGALKWYIEDSDIKCERVSPDEIIVDDRAASRSRPRSLFQLCWVPAEVLVESYPDHSHEIEDAIGRDSRTSTFHAVGGSARKLTTDMVEVLEGWHLRSGPDAKDGRHVICVESGTLLDDKEYDEDDFPFVFFPWNQRPIGWYPQGLVEQNISLQAEFTTLLRKIQRHMHLFSYAKIFAEEGSIKKEHLRNVEGDIIWTKTGSRPPVVNMPSAVSAEVFNHVWKLRDVYFEDIGVSQLSAQSKKPAGIESGKALRTILDVESRRFAQVMRQRERYYLRCAESAIRLGKQLYKSGSSDYKTYYRARDFVQTIKWQDVDMDRDDYVLQMYPTNLLPSTPAGRLQLVEELMASELISREQGLELLEFPDVEKFQSLANASIREIDMILERALYEGEYIPPERYMHLQHGVRRAQQLLSFSKTMGAPEERRNLLIQWIMDAEDLLTPAPAPEMPPGPAPTDGAPELPPQGEVMPPESLQGLPQA